MLPIRRVLARALHERTAPSRLSRARTARVVACALSGLGVWGTLARSAEAQSGRSASSDSARISLTLRDLPLQVALERLVAASGISLQYDTRVLRARAADPPRISCRVERQPAEAMLGCIVQEAGLDFYRLSTGTYVVIARAEEAPAYATLSGIVVDAANGSPLPAARIALAERPDVRVANDAGSFAFGRLAPGSYRLTVQAIGYEPYRRDVVVPADGRVRERILLNRYAVMTTPIVVNGLQPGAA
jgi:hypothetical protein